MRAGNPCIATKPETEDPTTNNKPKLTFAKKDLKAELSFPLGYAAERQQQLHLSFSLLRRTNGRGAQCCWISVFNNTLRRAGNLVLRARRAYEKDGTKSSTRETPTILNPQKPKTQPKNTSSQNPIIKQHRQQIPNNQPHKLSPHKHEAKLPKRRSSHHLG